MHMRGEKRKLTEENLGQPLLKCLGDLGMFHCLHTHLLARHKTSLQRIRLRYSKLPSLLVLHLTAGDLSQRGHDKKAMYHQSKHCLPLSRENKAKAVPCYVKSMTSSP